MMMTAMTAMTAATAAPVLGAAWGAIAAVPIVIRARRAHAVRRAGALVGAVGSPPRAAAWCGRLGGPVGHVARAVAERRRRRAETERLARELPLVLDLLQVAVGAGYPPRRALELVVQWGPPGATASLGGALHATGLGVALADALAEASRDWPVLAPITDALVASDRLGAPAGPVLTRLADESRAELRRAAEARARVLPVKLLFPLVFLVLPAFGLLTVVPALLSALSRS